MMAGMDWISLLLQVPLIGAFIYFALQQQKVFNEYLERREEAWRRFLSEEREELVNALRDLAQRIDRMSEDVRELRQAHFRGAWSREGTWRTKMETEK